MIEVRVDRRTLELGQQVAIVVEVVAIGTLAVLVKTGRAVRKHVAARAARFTDRVGLELARRIRNVIHTQAVGAAHGGHDVELPVQRVGAVIAKLRAAGGFRVR